MTCSVASSSIHGNQFIMFHGKNSTPDILGVGPRLSISLLALNDAVLRQNCKKHPRLVTLMTVCVCFSVGFTVMGFKPRSKIKDDHYVSPASFIYPSEKVGGALLPWLHSAPPPTARM